MNDELTELFNETLENVLRLNLGLDVYEYLNNNNRANWSDFEEELSIKNPIKGIEINFNKEIFEKWNTKYDNYKIINDDKDMSCIDITDELASEPFKYKEMTFVYLFTILEDFGNSIVKIVNYTYYKNEIEEKGKSWHSKVNKYAKAKNQNLIQNFAYPFNIHEKDIYSKFVDLFYILKNKRNKIAHELKYPDIQDFNSDINSLIILMCYLFHINDSQKLPVKFYPWYDYNKDET